MRGPMSLEAPAAVPVARMQRRRERVIDARICALSDCPKLRRSVDRKGVEVACCGADVFKAQFPGDLLDQVVAENPDVRPGFRSDENPLLFRLLMSPTCVRPECGVAEIEHAEKLLSVDPAELEEELFG